MQVILNTLHLKAVLETAAKGDIRYYLNGVYVETYPDCTIVVATDGHCLSAIRLPTEGNTNDNFPYPRFIIPRPWLEQLLKAVPKNYTLIQLAVEPVGEPTGGSGYQLSCTLSGQSFVTRSVDGKFPSWRRVVPEAKFSNEPGAFDVTLLAKFQKASKILGASKLGKIKVCHDGPSNGARVQLPGMDDYLGVVMPWKIHDEQFPTATFHTTYQG